MYRTSRWSVIGLIGDTGAQKQYLTRAGFLMEAFTVCAPDPCCGSDHRNMAVSPDAYASVSSLVNLSRSC